MTDGLLVGFGDLVAGGQFKGARPYQEDSFQIAMASDTGPSDCDLLLVLADGMGGHRGGAEASGIAVAAFVDKFQSARRDIATALREALYSANVAVGAQAAEHPVYKGMGCTLVACAVAADETARWISVGDSPIWRWRAGAMGMHGQLDRLNADHSMRPVLEELCRLGQASEGDIDAGAHQLRSAVTGDDMPLVDHDAPPARLNAGDALILASDGVEVLSSRALVRVCKKHEAATTVVANVLRKVEEQSDPSQDNATVVVYRHVASTMVQDRLRRLTAPTRPSRSGRRRTRRLKSSESE